MDEWDSSGASGSLGMTWLLSLDDCSLLMAMGKVHPMAIHRKRLDDVLVERGLAPTRARARALIMAGKVMVDERREDKAGHACPTNAVIGLIEPDHPYVSRGGVKLAGALDTFRCDVAGLVCADIGTSTGGFVDCLLQRGARRVYAVDTGNVIDSRLRTDERVIYLHDTNARYLAPDHFGREIDVITMDVSFISATKIIPALIPLLAPRGRMIILVKPQFEAGRPDVGKGGIVRDPSVLCRVLEDVARSAEQMGLLIEEICESPITGMDGNREFFLMIGKDSTMIGQACVTDRIRALFDS